MSQLAEIATLIGHNAPVRVVKWSSTYAIPLMEARELSNIDFSPFRPFLIPVSFLSGETKIAENIACLAAMTSR